MWKRLNSFNPVLLFSVQRYSNFIKQCFKGYRYKSGIAIFVWWRPEGLLNLPVPVLPVHYILRYPSYIKGYVRFKTVPLSTFSLLFLPLSIPLSTSFYIFLPLSISFYLFLPLSTSFYPFLPLSTFFYLFLPLSTSFYLFLPLSIPFYLFLPLSSPFCRFLPLSTFFCLFQPLSTSFYLLLAIKEKQFAVFLAWKVLDSANFLKIKNKKILFQILWNKIRISQTKVYRVRKSEMPFHKNKIKCHLKILLWFFYPFYTQRSTEISTYVKFSCF